MRFTLSILCLCGVTLAADPTVEAYNVRIGSQAFGTLYKFSTNDVVVEEAGHLLAMGSDIVKFALEPGKRSKEFKTLTAGVEANPVYLHLFDMPFRHYFAWTSAAGHSNGGYWRKGPNAAEEKI